MTYEQIRKDLTNKIYHPVYVLTGEEPFYIDEIATFIEDNVLDENERSFNQMVLYGADIDLTTLISYARRFPMLSNYQVIIVREAQEIKNIEDLALYVEKPLKSTILVLCYKYKKIDKRKTFLKLVEKHGVFYESKRLYDDKVPEWINQYVIEKGSNIRPKAAMLLAEYVGTDLSRVAHEIGKLLINIPGATQITEDHIEQYIGVSKEYNIFELQKALGEKDVFKANKIAHELSCNPKENPLIKIVPILFSFFSKLLVYHGLTDKTRSNVASVLGINPFFVPDYQRAAQNFPMQRLIPVISVFKEYDLKSKGVDNTSVEDPELLKEMIFKILH
jgi:DNA polymerase III subunit delta